MLFVSITGLASGPTQSRSASPIEPDGRLVHRVSIDQHLGRVFAAIDAARSGHVVRRGPSGLGGLVIPYPPHRR